MKKFVFVLSSLLLAVFAQAFSFGNLVKSVSDAAGVEQSAVEKSLAAKQESALAKYKESKVDFLKGFSLISEQLGATDLKSTADSALAKIQPQAVKDIDVESVAKTTQQVAELVKSDSVAKAAENAATGKYETGVAHFKKALESELEIAKTVCDLAKEARSAMEGASSAEKIRIAAALKPTMELAQAIPQDISNSKDAVKSMLAILKSKGANVSSELLSLLKK